MLAPFMRRLGFVPWAPRPPAAPVPPPPPTVDPVERCLRLIKQIGLDPKHIVDVGANHGSWTRMALGIFPEAHFTMLEPQAWLIDHVKDLLNTNPRVHWHNLGAGDQDGILKFTLDQHDHSSSFMHSTEEAAKLGCKQIDVPVVTLNKLLRDSGLPDPGIIKIDAEGLDLSVLKGCGSYLGSTDVFFVEAGILNKFFVNDLLSVVQLMKQHGYRLFDFTHLNRTQKHDALWLVEAAFIKADSPLDQAVVSYY
jgi:FkbM family methyltransferase